MKEFICVSKVHLEIWKAYFSATEKYDSKLKQYTLNFWSVLIAFDTYLSYLTCTQHQ